MSDFVKVGRRYLNLAQVLYAEWEPARESGGDAGGRLRVHLACPEPASVGASDWSVEPATLDFKGDDAQVLLAALNIRAGLS